MGRPTVFLFALACGISVSTVYLPQPLLRLISDDFHISGGTAGIFATSVQVGYALGILLLVPLGDRLPPRRLVSSLMIATALLLATSSAAATPTILAPILVAAGLTSVVPQILIPLAGRLVPAEQSGTTIGVLTTGLVCGMFGSRVIAGLVGQALGWRSVPIAFALLGLLTTAALFRRLPATVPLSSTGYGRILAGLPRLLRKHPELRQGAWIQFFIFAAFSATWAVLALQLTSRFGWSTGQAGMFGLVGLAAGLLTPLAGAQVDRRGALTVIGICLALTILAVIFIATGGSTVMGLAAGMFSLTIGAQCAQVAQQTRIFAAAPDARSSANTVYMFATYLGGSVGTQIGTTAFTHGGLPLVTGADAILIMVALLGYAAARLTRRTAA
ncbi:MFS transporter [Streptomyces sioyaensis]|uniref:MFS transporter n=1 Tax=Streptomyces sioyaensis TaxID=67364 RepID=UPI0037D46D60